MARYRAAQVRRTGCPSAPESAPKCPERAPRSGRIRCPSARNGRPGQAGFGAQVSPESGKRTVDELRLLAAARVERQCIADPLQLPAPELQEEAEMTAVLTQVHTAVAAVAEDADLDPVLAACVQLGHQGSHLAPPQARDSVSRVGGADRIEVGRTDRRSASEESGSVVSQGAGAIRGRRGGLRKELPSSSRTRSGFYAKKAQ